VIDWERKTVPAQHGKTPKESKTEKEKKMENTYDIPTLGFETKQHARNEGDTVDQREKSNIGRCSMKVDSSEIWRTQKMAGDVLRKVDRFAGGGKNRREIRN